MKLSTSLGWASVLCLSTALLQGQDTNSLEQLRRQLQQAKEAFEQTIAEHRKVIDQLSRRVAELEHQR